MTDCRRKKGAARKRCLVRRGRESRAHRITTLGEDWRMLPAQFENGKWVAYVPNDRSLEAGTYQLQAVAQDRAGNEKSGDRFRDGAPAIVPIDPRNQPGCCKSGTDGSNGANGGGRDGSSGADGAGSSNGGIGSGSTNADQGTIDTKLAAGVVKKVKLPSRRSAASRRPRSRRRTSRRSSSRDRRDAPHSPRTIPLTCRDARPDSPASNRIKHRPSPLSAC